MIVINKKKILFWTGIIATFMFLYSITAYNVNNTKNKTVATVALPVNNKVIVIDAGHGVPDERSCLLTLKITLIFYKK